MTVKMKINQLYLYISLFSIENIFNEQIIALLLKLCIYSFEYTGASLNSRIEKLNSSNRLM